MGYAMKFVTQLDGADPFPPDTSRIILLISVLAFLSIMRQFSVVGVRKVNGPIRKKQERHPKCGAAGLAIDPQLCTVDSI